MKHLAGPHWPKSSAATDKVEERTSRVQEPSPAIELSAPSSIERADPGEVQEPPSRPEAAEPRSYYGVADAGSSSALENEVTIFLPDPRD